MRLKKLLWLFGLVNLVKPYEKAMTAFVKIHAAANYLRLIRFGRKAYLRLFEILLSFGLLIIGMIVLHGSLFLSLIPSLAPSARWVFLLGMAEILTAALYLIWFFSAKRWLREAAKSSFLAREALRTARKEDSYK